MCVIIANMVLRKSGFSDTLLTFEDQWGIEETQTQRDLPRLDADECALYDDLRDNRIRCQLSYHRYQRLMCSLYNGLDDDY